MTPLSEALTAAQRRTLQAIEKAYLSGMGTPQSVTEQLKLCGITDTVDVSYLLQCLGTLKVLGAELPAEPNGKFADDPASDKQTKLIADLMDRHADYMKLPKPEGLSKAQASQVIDELQKGSYDPQKWQPF